ncbi:hypothetical protein CBM2615_B200057 [Cupriavidus taiwanensis]|uniref:Uncharacterized protein n=1 Tax=Cupriavidus taiwanensis TaxID=164546 RepID=A0A375E936_9BURK|nr:hypothetical protein [Cupriavidus taiwanensis]SOZ67319.1 hypothetical protein CBM2614_B210057 [Cupriavidus taiwanensis]SOZ68544.1 hypothetical protein CBM2615_B200057 [Cupriavidus taiwanensis]SOZ71581.1 hypothetical protein CBM2613_B180056 [Cupriavidus taiwanensis]SPA09377.1 hypothetical protein CBM2625_B180055 [Cupriavidus taiwanensis]
MDWEKLTNGGLGEFHRYPRRGRRNRTVPVLLVLAIAVALAVGYWMR